MAESLPPNLASNTVASNTVASNTVASNTVASRPQVSTNSPPALQQVNNNNRSPAAAQPFVRCPSAMKCVPKINCDFNGVMVNTRVFLSPVQEKQRVPLIVSREITIK